MDCLAYSKIVSLQLQELRIKIEAIAIYGKEPKHIENVLVAVEKATKSLASGDPLRARSQLSEKYNDLLRISSIDYGDGLSRCITKGLREFFQSIVDEGIDLILRRCRGDCLMHTDNPYHAQPGPALYTSPPLKIKKPEIKYVPPQPTG